MYYYHISLFYIWVFSLPCYSSCQWKYESFFDKGDVVVVEKLDDDYDKLNRRIIQKYGITVPKDVQEKVKFKIGETSILNEEDLYKFDIKQCMRKGHSFKDYICPNTFEFKSYGCFHTTSPSTA